MKLINTLLHNIQYNKKYQFWLFFAILVFLTLFMMWCNGLSSSYQGYDFYFHYRRLDVLIDALKQGLFPNYTDYSNVDGYGYFTKGFYCDAILIPFALIGLFTSTYFAYDVMIFTMTVLCGVFTYHAVRVIYKSSYVALLTSILYTFAIYRLYDVYQRAAFGEALSFTFLPLIFLGLYHIIKGDYKKWYILAIGYSLLIFTHVISSVLTFITLLIILVVCYKPILKEPKRIGYLFLAGLVTIAVTAYYLFPVIEQLASNTFLYSMGGKAGYGKVGFDLVFWGLISGILYPGKAIWSGVGIILILLILLRFFIKGKKSDGLKSVDIGVIIGICFIIASSRIFPWGTFPFSLIGFIQYPWRLYEFASCFFAVAGAYYLSLLFVKTKSRIIVFAVIVVATMVTTYIHSENYKYLYYAKALQIYAGNSDENPAFYNHYHLIGGEYFPARIVAIDYIYIRGEKVEFKNADTQISNLKRNKNVTSFDIEVHATDSLLLPLLYYKGYHVTLDGIDLPVQQSPTGLVQIVADKSGRVEAYYKGTTTQWVSFYISIISILAFSIFIIWSKKREHETGR
ncbi:hypothetical protein [Dysgonomonas reticulitermitis]